MRRSLWPAAVAAAVLLLASATGQAGAAPALASSAAANGSDSGSAGHLYWMNFRETEPSTIGRAGLDRTGANQRFITAPAAAARIAVDAGHIYWSDWWEGSAARTWTGRASTRASSPPAPAGSRSTRAISTGQTPMRTRSAART